jgi:hypothetical protein
VGIVLNWIAQGVLVAAAAGFGLWLLPAGRARARVRVWWTVVATVLCLPLVSWLLRPPGWGGLGGPSRACGSASTCGRSSAFAADAVPCPNRLAKGFAHRHACGWRNRRPF